jgi:hypothetical protein
MRIKNQAIMRHKLEMLAEQSVQLQSEASQQKIMLQMSPSSPKQDSISVQLDQNSLAGYKPVER